MNVFRMGLKSVIYRKKQYLSLFLVTIFGVAISLFALFVVDGMLNALETKGKIYYGGDLMFIGSVSGEVIIDNQKQTKAFLEMPHIEEKLEKLQTIFPPDSVIAERYEAGFGYMAFVFEGITAQQRSLKGINFNKEKKVFSELNYIEGNSDEMAGSNGVLLSEPISKMLNIHVGDSLTFMFTTLSGYTDTAEVIVKGIFRDSSIFGTYTSYFDIDFLRNCVRAPLHTANRVAITLADKDKTDKKINEYQHKMESVFNMFPLVEKKQIYTELVDNGTLKDDTFALIKLSANFEDIQILIDAMWLVVGFVIAMLVIIIVIGVSSTYRVIIMKRINEIGIYMAIGMKKNRIIVTLLSETFALIVMGCIFGFILSLILCSLTPLVNLSFIPAFDIFLTNGVIKPIISFSSFVILMIIVSVTTLLAVLFSIKKLIKITPVEALSVIE
ncbi:MAG: FtsX-like permease family protein [Treponema sp.]|jgi:ABC-type antimicrobial peptide transport system permease subunit|nr:FtsX-like permease family protein [Treponema sp.]